MATDLGPLPQSDRNAELQELSIRALQQSIFVGRFVLRDERITDAGVDYSIELKINNAYTNFRSQLQLKSTESIKPNKDASYSVEIDTSNLNYLLNGTSPLYILYVVPTDKLYFAWARDERRRIETAKPDWMKQGSVTLRFAEQLTPEAAETIHDRIRREAQLSRHVYDVLSKASVTEPVTLHISPATLGVTDTAQIRALLLDHGLSVVSAGYAPRVLELADLLTPGDKRLPRILLTRAFAEYVQSRYMLALGHVAEAAIRRGELSPSDGQFLDYLKCACEFHTGKIGLDEYSDNQDRLASSATGEFALARRLDSVRRRHLAERNDAQREALFQELQSVVAKVFALDGASEAFKLQARLVLNYAEGTRFIRVFADSVGLIRMRQSMGKPTDGENLLNRAMETLKQWRIRAIQAIDDAVVLGNPQLLGDAKMGLAAIMFVYLSNATLQVDPDTARSARDQIIDFMMNDIKTATGLYEQTGYLEGELRAKILLANFADLAGHGSDARALGTQVLHVAKAMGYDDLAEDAQSHIDGVPLHRMMEIRMQALAAEDQDVSLAARTEEEMRYCARDSLEALGLPASRLPVMERECLSWRAIALERLNWCRHIELIQNLAHERHPSTHFRQDPERHCTCTKFGYESMVPSTDAAMVIVAFKRSWCDSCTSREPKRVSDQ